jgi:protein involved in polysaccharide export with SLBB domain
LIIGKPTSMHNFLSLLQKQCSLFLACLLFCLQGVPGEAQVNSPQPGSVASTENSVAMLRTYLGDHPEVSSELKSLLADRLGEQGSAIDAQSITDEVVISRLQTDAAFRSEALRVMVNRGYISEQQAEVWAQTLAVNRGPNAEPGNGTNTAEQQYAQPENPEARYPQGQYQAEQYPGQYQTGQYQPEQYPVQQPGQQPAQTGVLQTQTSNQTTQVVPGQRGTSGPGVQQPRQPNAQPNIAEPIPLMPNTVPQKNPYPGLPSTADLYRRYEVENKPLKRFGADIFRPDIVGLDRFPMDLPAGSDYVLGTGDTIVVDIWGGVTQQVTRIVDREGRISLPDVGPIAVAGFSLSEAQKRVQAAAQPQYHDAKVALSVTRLRTVRVYVVGYVQRPGAYDISSLSTPLNALYAAGGPTAAGSMRVVKHYRGATLISQQDLYDLLISGVRQAIEHLEPGDTIMVPPAGPQVGVSGTVRRPAIYELKDQTDKLSDVVDMAGGVTASASLTEVRVERVEPHEQRVTLKVPLELTKAGNAAANEASPFMVQDGDRIYVGAIDPFKNQTVYLQGHIYRPGPYPFTEGMKISDLVKSYQDVLPEPAAHAEIVRLQAPDYRPLTIQFNLLEMLSGNEPIALQAFDTVRIFGRYEVDAPKVAIYGQVLRPGEYPMSAGLTAAALVRMAGGFNRSAYLDSATLASYVVENGQRVVTDQKTVQIGAAVGGNRIADLSLSPGDVLTILQIPGWSDIGRSVTIKGEVMYPGNYGINEGEKLSTFLKRVGGFRSTAYAPGIVLERDDVRKIEERGRQELISRLQSTNATIRISPNTTGQDQAAVLQAAQQQQQQAIANLRSQPVPGRLVIDITSNISDWENTPNDIQLRAGDVITVPKRPNFVLSLGQVYNANAITFKPGKTAGWYLRQAGGPTQLANKKGIYVVRANGSVISSGGAADLFSGGVLNAKLQAGDVLVVPEKFVTGSSAWKTTLETAQFLASLAIAAAAVAHL